MPPILAPSLLVASLLAAAATPARAERTDFRSPSGNIRCVVTDEGDRPFAECSLDALDRSFTDAPEGCDGAWGDRFRVYATGPGRVECHDGGAGETEARVLPYGVAVRLAGITCASDRTGVTCTNADGGGFSVRRAEQSIF